jgi:hypothetical protein
MVVKYEGFIKKVFLLQIHSLFTKLNLLADENESSVQVLQILASIIMCSPTN